MQIVYEHNLRPAEKQHAPWLDRVTAQLLAAYTLLDQHLSQADSEALTQASLTAAVAWSFSQFTVASVVKADAFPHVQRHAERLERHPAFKRYPIV